MPAAVLLGYETCTPHTTIMHIFFWEREQKYLTKVQRLSQTYKHRCLSCVWVGFNRMRSDASHSRDKYEIDNEMWRNKTTGWNCRVSRTGATNYYTQCTITLCQLDGRAHTPRLIFLCSWWRKSAIFGRSKVNSDCSHHVDWQPSVKFAKWLFLSICCHEEATLFLWERVFAYNSARERARERKIGKKVRRVIGRLIA